MDIVLLPVLSRRTQPSLALQIMRDSRRSAAVLVDSPPQGLISSFAVRMAKNEKLTSLETAPVEPLVVLFDGDFLTEGYAALKLPADAYFAVQSHLLQTFPGSAHRRLSVSSNALPAFEALLTSAGPQAFLGWDRGAAVVLTQHESQGEQAGAPLGCCCLNPNQPHEYPAGRKKTGQPCDNCSYSIDC
jgi:hypothetical protein